MSSSSDRTQKAVCEVYGHKLGTYDAPPLLEAAGAWFPIGATVIATGVFIMCGACGKTLAEIKAETPTEAVLTQ